MEYPSMNTVYQAISALYDNPNTTEKEKASIWLGDVQKSIHSWKIADDLLQQKRDVQSCYFAAQTMRSKVQHSLSELPAESLMSLRDSLIAHLKSTEPHSVSGPILTQLSLALADLALQMQTWHNCTSDLINSFSHTNYYALLEVLTVLPQEIDSTNLKLGDNRRESIKAELRSNAQVVTHFLKESISSSQNTNVALKIVKCMTSWIQVKAINIQDVPQNAVIGYCLQVLRDFNSINTLHDAAADCICALLHSLEDSNNCDEIEKLLFESIAALEESYHMSVAHEDEEKAASYARVFTELAETFLEKIIVNACGGETHFAMRSLELALVCVGHHDYEVAEITFNLWYRLSEILYQRDYEPLTDAFKPYIERLIEALARHCQCEPDQTHLPDEGDDFFEFRIKVMELIKDVVFIVGSSSVFRQMFSCLQADLAWEQTEAALFIMQAVAKNILPDEYEYVPKVIEAILSMPDTTHSAVRKTCILLLGELCEWIERHTECLEPCIQFLVRALHEPTLSYAAALALQNICKACRAAASQHTRGLLEAARGADTLPPAAAAALMRGLAAALGRLPPAQLIVGMREAVAAQLNPLVNMMSRGEAPRKGTPSDPVLWLDRIAALFRDVEPPTDAALIEHPCLPALADAWPILEKVMEQYREDGRVMERVCRALRFAVRCCGEASAPLLPALCTTLARLYAARAHSCLLYLASILVDELSVRESSHLIALLQDMMPRAFLLLQQPDGLRNNPDTVDDLFRLCIRYLQRIPLEFLSSGAMTAVMQCAILASRLDHREANSSVMKFIYDLAKVANSCTNGRVRVLAEVVLSECNEELTYAIMEASVIHLHSYMLTDVGEALLELVTWQRKYQTVHLKTALDRLPTQTPAHATPLQREQFLHYALKAEKCKEMVRLLRDFARLYR